MPKRKRWNNTKTKHTPSRKYRKSRFINVKNKTKDPVLGHQGVYYSYHVHEDNACWMDVYFPSLKHKGRYFSAALITCEYQGMNDDEELARRLAQEKYPDAWLDMKSVPCARKSPKDPMYWACVFEKSEDYEDKRAFQEHLEKELNAKPRMIRPSITIDRDYWAPAIGLHGVVNTPSLTEESIIEFIELFRSLGEPIDHGLVWEGDEEEVIPGRIEERYAQSRSNQSEASTD